jgi:hypothetical protein
MVDAMQPAAEAAGAAAAASPSHTCPVCYSDLPENHMHPCSDPNATHFICSHCLVGVASSNFETPQAVLEKGGSIPCCAGMTLTPRRNCFVPMQELVQAATRIHDTDVLTRMLSNIVASLEHIQKNTSNKRTLLDSIDVGDDVDEDDDDSGEDAHNRKKQKGASASGGASSSSSSSSAASGAAAGVQAITVFCPTPKQALIQQALLRKFVTLLIRYSASADLCPKCNRPFGGHSHCSAVECAIHVVPGAASSAAAATSTTTTMQGCGTRFCAVCLYAPKLTREHEADGVAAINHIVHQHIATQHSFGSAHMETDKKHDAVLRIRRFQVVQHTLRAADVFAQQAQRFAGRLAHVDAESLEDMELLDAMHAGSDAAGTRNDDAPPAASAAAAAAAAPDLSCVYASAFSYAVSTLFGAIRGHLIKPDTDQFPTALPLDADWIAQELFVRHAGFTGPKALRAVLHVSGAPVPGLEAIFQRPFDAARVNAAIERHDHRRFIDARAWEVEDDDDGREPLRRRNAAFLPAVNADAEAEAPAAAAAAMPAVAPEPLGQFQRIVVRDLHIFIRLEVFHLEAIDVFAVDFQAPPERKTYVVNSVLLAIKYHVGLRLVRPDNLAEFIPELRTTVNQLALACIPVLDNMPR